MDDFEFVFFDRVQKIRSMNELYHLEDKSFVSFSGGKDSTVLSELIDIALPNNQIPRVYIDTGIDYKMIREFVRRKAETDERIRIISPARNITAMLADVGYPFKSKEHSQKVAIFQRAGKTKTVSDYLGEGKKASFLCPEKLRYNFTGGFPLKVSDRCCHELKKKPCAQWQKENGRPITITGIRQSEGGLRQSVRSCAIFADEGATVLKKFHPLLVVSDEWINEFVSRYGVRLCELYYPPYNFRRTGCKGCPYSVDLQRQLDIMSMYLPAERKQCELIWGKVYAEYRRIGYRLTDEPSVFDE